MCVCGCRIYESLKTMDLHLDLGTDLSNAAGHCYCPREGIGAIQFGISAMQDVARTM